MWTPTLDDVINAPRDLDDLRMHLQSVGALPTDLRPATLASPPIQQLVPPNIPPSGPSVPLRPPTRMDTAMKTSELAEPSGTMTPPIVSSPDAISSGGPVKPMTAPTLTGGPGAFPGMESSSGLPMGTPGTAQGGMLPFYQSQFDRAAAANRPDSMSDHPSFLGKVGHVLGRIGNVALNAAVPGLAETIPGTDAYKVATEQRAKRELAGEQARESKEKLQTAETAEAEARAKKLAAEGNPDIIQDASGQAVGWRDVDGKLHTFDEEGTPAAIKKIGESWEGKQAAQREPNIDKEAVQSKMQETNPATSKPFTAYEARIQLAQDLAGTKPEKPDTETQEAQKYEDIRKRITLKQPVSADEHAWAGAYEKRKTLAPFASVVAQTPVREEARGDKSYDKQSGILDKVGQPIEALSQRMGRLKEGLAQGTPIADALVAPELLSIMAGGQGTGLRMTDAEINRIVGGQGHWDALRKQAQLWALDPSKANSITPEQRKEIRALVSAVDAKMQKKLSVLNQAHQQLLDTDDPDKHRKIVVDTRKQLTDIDSGEGGGGGGQKLKIGGTEYEVNANGRINVNGTWYQTTPGSKQVTRVAGP